MGNTFIVDSAGGISGSLQHLVTGDSYLVAGDNVTITSQSNGQVLIAASTGSAFSAISGIYGDGSDGALTVSSDTTLTNDRYYSSVTVQSGKKLSTNGYKLFVKGPLIVSGTLECNGHDAVHGTSTGGSGGPAASLAGGTPGGNASSGNGGSQFVGLLGLNDGAGSSPGGGSGGAYNGTTEGNTVRALPFALMGVVCKPSDNSWVKVSGGCGGGASAGSTGGGGGGGVMIVAAASITVVSGGSITVDGGNGAGDAAGGSGAGSGGLMILVSQTPVVNAGTITANGGTGGSGFGGATGGNGGNGVVIQHLSP